MQLGELIQIACNHYVDALLFTSDNDYSSSQLSDELIDSIQTDVTKFITQVSRKYGIEFVTRYRLELAHDFLYTRNFEGCGFWDGDWQRLTDDNGYSLTQLAHSFNEVSLYLGDNNKLYC